MAIRGRKQLLGGGAIALFVIAGAGLMLGYTYREMVEVPLLPVVGVLAAIALPVTIVLARRAGWGRKDLGAYVGISALVMMLVMLLGCILILGYMTALNAWLDDSPAERHVVKLHELRRKRGWQRTIVVDSWRTAGARETLWVDNDLVDPKPSFVVVTTRDGFFGFEWIADVARSP